MNNSELIMSLINVIGIDLELDKAIKDVVLGLLELPKTEPKKEPAKRGRPKKTERRPNRSRNHSTPASSRRF